MSPMLVGCSILAQEMVRLSAIEQVMSTWMGRSDAGMVVCYDSNFVTGWDEGFLVVSVMGNNIAPGSNVCAGNGLRELNLFTTHWMHVKPAVALKNITKRLISTSSPMHRSKSTTSTNNHTYLEDMYFCLGQNYPYRSNVPPPQSCSSPTMTSLTPFLTM